MLIGRKAEPVYPCGIAGISYAALCRARSKRKRELGRRGPLGIVFMDLSPTQLLLVLVLAPALTVPAAYKRGCRVRELTSVQIVAALTTVGFWPAFYLYTEIRSVGSGAIAYGLACTSLISLSMIWNVDRDGGDDGDKSDRGPSPPIVPLSIDWTEFERSFWEHVDQRQPQRSHS